MHAGRLGQLGHAWAPGELIADPVGRLLDPTRLAPGLTLHRPRQLGEHLEADPLEDEGRQRVGVAQLGAGAGGQVPGSDRAQRDGRVQRRSREIEAIRRQLEPQDERCLRSVRVSVADAARSVQQLPDGELVVSRTILGDRAAQNRADARVSVFVPASRSAGLQPLERAAKAARFDLQKKLLLLPLVGTLREQTLF